MLEGLSGKCGLWLSGAMAYGAAKATGFAIQEARAHRACCDKRLSLVRAAARREALAPSHPWILCTCHMPGREHARGLRQSWPPGS